MRAKQWRNIPLLVGSIALTTCNKAPVRASTKIATDECLDLSADPPAGRTDLKQETTACVERNAALYARGPDSPDSLSKAIIVKCQPIIMHYVEQEARKAGERPQYAAALEAWRQHALPVIAEARARRCYS